MNVSFLIPTYHKGLFNLKKALASIFDTVSDPDQIEVLFRLDDGDTEALDFINQYIEENNSYNIKKIIGERYGYIKQYKYMNELASHSKGNFICPFPDDYMIHTENWDISLEKFLNKSVVLKPSEIYHIKHYGTPSEYTTVPSTNICPFISHLIYKAMGYMSPVIAYDSWIDYISKQLKIKREVDMKITHFKTTNSLRKYRRNEFSKAKSLLKADTEKVKKYIRKLNKKRGI